jgi:FkbM family methyltransferase
MITDAIHSDSDGASNATLYGDDAARISRAPARRAGIGLTPVRACARMLFGHLLPKLPYPVLRGPLRGLRFILGAAAGEAGGVSIHLGSQEPEQCHCLAKILRPGQVFFDVGANVGFYSLLAARLVGSTGRVVAIEPLPRNIAFLYRHIALNKAHNVTILPLACANRSAIESFCEGENNALGHLAGTSDKPDASSPAFRASLVATLSLDEAVEALALSPDVIKIDVEGAELRVLEGARNILAEVRPALLLSVHSDQLREDCLRFLEGFGYRWRPLNGSTFGTATEFFAQSAR